MRRRGVTLIEAVLYISIALALIVGGLVFYQQASKAQKISEMTRLGSALLAEARSIYSISPIVPIGQTNSPGVGPGMSSTLIAMGAVPPQYIDDSPVTKTTAAGPITTSLKNPWDGQLEIWVNNSNILLIGPARVGGTIYIWISDVSPEACARIVASDLPGGQLNRLKISASKMFGHGYAGAVVTDAASQNSFDTAVYAYSVDQAAEACRYGTDAYGNTIGRYTGSKPSLERVNIMLNFTI